MTGAPLPIRAIEIAAEPAAVLAFLARPESLPLWAPGFAQDARPGAPGRWTITLDGRSFELLVRVDQEAGTLDLLAPAAPDRGAFLRVVPCGDGCLLSFCVNLGPAASAARAARQMHVIEGELEEVRRRCTA